ncbi:hypothetical protein HAX54_030256 [Datura stramonium]|uniref:Secreted protein n=1 Tax=Datura stramonium TaxID=4076 RepID=A0ABS8VAA2_DATST|nr:hypothetical protein [Datura stramonium]
MASNSLLILILICIFVIARDSRLYKHCLCRVFSVSLLSSSRSHPAGRLSRLQASITQRRQRPRQPGTQQSRSVADSRLRLSIPLPFFDNPHSVIPHHQRKRNYEYAAANCNGSEIFQTTEV